MELNCGKLKKLMKPAVRITVDSIKWVGAEVAVAVEPKRGQKVPWVHPQMRRNAAFQNSESQHPPSSPLLFLIYFNFEFSIIIFHQNIKIYIYREREKNER